MSGRVSLVIVSHSATLAQGVKDVAEQMAPDVHIEVAGGLLEGGIGTSFDLIELATRQAVLAAEGNGVVILTDLGSATLTVESVIEFADDPDQLHFVDGPLVEGAVAGAVEAQQGGNVDAVVDAVESTRGLWNGKSGVDAVFAAVDGTDEERVDDAAVPDGADSAATIKREVKVADSAGLHARPAARLARMAAKYPSIITVNGVSATSVMEIMALAVKQGDTVVLEASGDDADTAVKEIGDAIEAGFDNK